MRQFSAPAGSWALVAGAAEGLGEAFSETLAALGLNLVLVDHQQDLLESVSSGLERRYRVSTRNMLLDLAGEEAWERCMQATEGLDCRLLVYVAAYSRVTLFRNHTQETLDRTLAVNTRTVIRLVHAFASRLRGSGLPGGILLMGSLSGLVAPPLVAPYAATKAFNIRLAESLFPEFRRDGIHISACVAGIIDTPAYRASRPAGRFKPRAMTPSAVARYAISHLGRKALLIPGTGNRISAFILQHLLPRRLAVALTAGTMKRMYKDEWIRS
jgi:short-subunit dehydrogenase